MKKIILSVIFIILLIIVLINLDQILKVKHYVPNAYKNLKAGYDTDVLFIGTSRVARGFSPIYIFNKYGIITYNMGSDAQSYKTTIQLIKKYKPKIAVIDISVVIRIPNIHLSWARLDLVNLFTIFERYKVAKEIFGQEKYLSELNAIAKYHYRWKTLSGTDFDRSTNDYLKGLDPIDIFRSVEEVNTPPSYEMDFKTEKINIDEIMNVAAKYDTKVFFIMQPNVMENRMFIKKFKEYADNKNVDFIDYNEKEIFEKLKLNYKNDMTDISHVNMYGSYKIMDHLMPILIKKYNLVDQRNNPKYKSWHEDYIKYARTMNKAEIIEQKTLEKWFSLSKYDNYTIMIAANGKDVINKLSPEIKEYLKQYGLSKYNTSDIDVRYAAIIDDGKVYFEKADKSLIQYKGRVNNHFNLLLSADIKQATINVSGFPRSKNMYGLNFVIYDKVNREIVDSIWIDPNKGNIINR